MGKSNWGFEYRTNDLGEAKKWAAKLRARANGKMKIRIVHRPGREHLMGAYEVQSLG